MFQSILVPLDGSTFGEHALPPAVSIARKASAQLTLLHVHAPLKSVYLEGAAYMDDTLEADIRAQHEAYLDVVRERVRGIDSSIKAESKIIDGEVAATIAAEAGNADLVIMTTHGRGALGRFWLGSVTDQVIRHVEMPLLLVRPQETIPDLNTQPSLRHLLIPLDGTEFAEHILESATSLARLMEGEITLVRIIKPVVALNSPVEAASVGMAVQGVLEKAEVLQKQLQDEAQKYLDAVAERIRSTGLQVNTVVDIEHQPAAAILQDVDEKNVDLIALETHGRRGLSRFFLGSIADKLIRAATVPVFVHRGSA